MQASELVKMTMYNVAFLSQVVSERCFAWNTGLEEIYFGPFWLKLVEEIYFGPFWLK